MRIFITGASGFIGSHLARRVLAAGHECAILALPDDPLKRLNGIEDRLMVIRGDLSRQGEWREVLKRWKPHSCIHLAWFLEPGDYLRSIRNIQCVDDSLALIQGCATAGCGYFLGVGTCFEYEAASCVLAESQPANPHTLYAASKLACLYMGRQIAEAASMEFGWARIFYPYGPGEDERRLVPAAMGALTGQREFLASTGEQVRDFIYVADVASALGTLVERSAGGIYNVCSGQQISVRSLLEAIGEILGNGQLIRFGALEPRGFEPPFLCGDNRRLRELGWAPAYSLHEGLQQTFAWWRERLPR